MVRRHAPTGPVRVSATTGSSKNGSEATWLQNALLFALTNSVPIPAGSSAIRKLAPNGVRGDQARASEAFPRRFPQRDFRPISAWFWRHAVDEFRRRADDSLSHHMVLRMQGKLQMATRVAQQRAASLE